MSARNPPKPGWVTVAAAAAALTEAGDPIDASNVSRYLKRNPEIPSEKGDKFRFVDLAALKAHRSSSVFVADKRDARDLADFGPMRTPVATPRASDYADDGDEGSEKSGSPLTAGKLELQQIELRRRRREEEVEMGRLVPAEDLQAVVSGMMAAFMSELARQEQTLSNKFGREIGAAVRQAHRSARTAAAARLIAAAEEHLNPASAARLTQPDPDAAAVA